MGFLLPFVLACTVCNQLITIFLSLQIFEMGFCLPPALMVVIAWLVSTVHIGYGSPATLPVNHPSYKDQANTLEFLLGNPRDYDEACTMKLVCTANQLPDADKNAHRNAPALLVAKLALSAVDVGDESRPQLAKLLTAAREDDSCDTRYPDCDVSNYYLLEKMYELDAELKKPQEGSTSNLASARAKRSASDRIPCDQCLGEAVNCGVGAIMCKACILLNWLNNCNNVCDFSRIPTCINNAGHCLFDCRK